MNNQPPENNEQNYPNIQNTTDQNQATTFTQPHTENKNVKENTTTRKDNAKQREATQHPNAKPTKASTEESHIIPETQSLPETTRVSETYPIPTTQEQDEFFSSPSLATSNRFQPLQNTPNPQNITTPETSKP